MGDDRVEEAVLDANGIVRVTDDVTDSPRALLEIHYFIKTKGRKNGTKFGHGPFASVNFGATGGDTLSSFGLGYMIGWKRNSDPDNDAAFNIGIGVSLDQNVKKLGDGIFENEPLPAGETEIRFKEDSELAGLIFVSATF